MLESLTFAHIPTASVSMTRFLGSNRELCKMMTSHYEPKKWFQKTVRFPFNLNREVKGTMDNSYEDDCTQNELSVSP